MASMRPKWTSNRWLEYTLEAFKLVWYLHQAHHAEQYPLINPHNPKLRMVIGLLLKISPGKVLVDWWGLNPERQAGFPEAIV